MGKIISMEQYLIKKRNHFMNLMRQFPHAIPPITKAARYAQRLADHTRQEIRQTKTQMSLLDQVSQSTSPIVAKGKEKKEESK